MAALSNKQRPQKAPFGVAFLLRPFDGENHRKGKDLAHLKGGDYE